MIKRYFTILFIFIITNIFGQNMFVQPFETGGVSTLVQRNEGSVLVAYSGSDGNVLVLKSKDATLKIKSVSIYSVLGTLVAQYSVNSGFQEINIDKLRTGKYFMRYVMSNNEQKVIQIIKQ